MSRGRPVQGMSPPRLAALYVYPLKSAGGIGVDRVRVDATGLRHDRRWMVVDAAGRFVSQRTHVRMALLRTALLDAGAGGIPGRGPGGTLRVSAPGTAPLDLPVPDADPRVDGRAEDEEAEDEDAEDERVPVWGEERYAVSCGPEAAAWVSDFLRLPCRVVRAVAPAGLPRVDERGRVRAGFADAYPALVLSTASLEDLNARLPEPVPMNRFRPNLVVSGVPAYAEDGWERVRMGAAGEGVALRAAKPCYRCVITTTDQESGARGDEPLRTLATYRRAPGGEVAFGLNMRFEGAGTLAVGAPVEAIPPS